MADGFSWEGIEEINKLAADLATNAGRVGALGATVLKKSAAEVEAGGKSFAPVDTGALRNSIGTDFIGDGRTGSMTAEIGPSVNYGHFVELGTSRMAPRAFMGPALDRAGPGFVAAMEQLGAANLLGES